MEPHPFGQIPIELFADARRHLMAASFASYRWPGLTKTFIALAVESLALRAQWEVARASDTQDTSQIAIRPPLVVS